MTEKKSRHYDRPPISLVYENLPGFGVDLYVGGREGASRSSDNQLDIRLSPPGSNRPGTNPEQLFAAGWSACFIGAMNRAASGLKVKLPAVIRKLRSGSGRACACPMADA